MTLGGLSVVMGASVGVVSFCCAFEHKWLGIAVVAELTADAFPAWRRVRLAPAEELCND